MFLIRHTSLSLTVAQCNTVHKLSNVTGVVEPVVTAPSECLFIQVILHMINYTRTLPQRCPRQANNKIYTKE